MLIVIGVSLLIWVRSRKDPVDKHSVGTVSYTHLDVYKRQTSVAGGSSTP